MLLTTIAFTETITAIAREIALWGGVFLLFASGLSLYWGWNKRKLSRVISETPRQPISEVQSPGLVRVRGTVTPQVEQDTFTSPITSTEDCVLSAWEIKEKYDTPKTNSWERSAWGVTTVPFYLSNHNTERKIPVEIDDVVVGNNTDDVFTPETLLSTNGVAVDGLQCEFEAFDVHIETDYAESPPKQVAHFIDETDGLSEEPMTTSMGGLVIDESKRKYLEQTLTTGDTVSILGYAKPRQDGMVSQIHQSDLILTQTEESPLYLSEHSFDEIPNGKGALVFSLLTGVLGLGLLAIHLLV